MRRFACGGVLRVVGVLLGVFAGAHTLGASDVRLIVDARIDALVGQQKPIDIVIVPPSGAPEGSWIGVVNPRAPLSFSAGQPLRTGWKLPIAALDGLKLSIPQAAIGKSTLTFILISNMGVVLAEAKTELVVEPAPADRTASSAPSVATPRTEQPAARVASSAAQTSASAARAAPTASSAVAPATVVETSKPARVVEAPKPVEAPAKVEPAPATVAKIESAPVPAVEAKPAPVVEAPKPAEAPAKVEPASAPVAKMEPAPAPAVEAKPAPIVEAPKPAEAPAKVEPAPATVAKTEPAPAPAVESKPAPVVEASKPVDAPAKVEPASAPVAKTEPSPAPAVEAKPAPVVEAPKPAEAPAKVEPVTVAKTEPAAPPATVSPAATAPSASSQADWTRLINRGQQHLAQGNVAVARQYFLRAASAGSAAGALRLAETYDPRQLAQLRVVGLAADLAEARKWYERARDLGAPEAADRLSRLPSG